MTFNIARKNLYLNSFKTEQRVHLTTINCRWNNLENVDYVGGVTEHGTRQITDQL